MRNRRRFKQARSLEQRLAEEANRLREIARALPPSAERDRLLRRAQQDETALHLADWLNSCGQRPPIGS